MKVAVSSDKYTDLIEVLLNELKARGHTAIYFGPQKNEKGHDWPEVSVNAATQVADGHVDQAILCCWTGTGASIAANKVKGVRCALCIDKQTAIGARKWNHANALAVSLRTTSAPILKEILDGWFETPFTDDEWNLTQVGRINRLDDLHL